MTACRPRRISRPARAARALVLPLVVVLSVAACGDEAPSREGAAPERAAPERVRDEAPPGRTVATAPGFLEPVEERAAPTRLRITSIGVDVAVVPVGVDGAGDMQVPGPEVAGWYRFGPHPGEPGSSVLAAHVDYDGRPGAFFRLRELEVGDRVEVGDGAGAVQLAVTEVAQVPKDGLEATGAFERSGRPRVALVTCGGEFDRERRSYEDNVIAWAEPVA
jgi:sortase (surface protein transpeptidase)